MRRIDINVDVGEGFPFDDELLQIATSANVCCGVHAGSVALTLSTLEVCATRGVRAGAHPGFPNRESMGRAPIAHMNEDERALLTESLLDQVGVGTWSYVKPHGALYNSSTRQGAVTVPLVKLMHSVRLPLLGLPGTHHEDIAFAAHVPFFREGFADRAYRRDGTLVPRTEPGAVLSDPAEIADQVLVLASRVDSICVHGDSPGCVRIAALVREILESNGYEVGP